MVVGGVDRGNGTVGGGSAVPVRRTGKPAIVFRSPGPNPNDLRATDAELWIIDQSEGK